MISLAFAADAPPPPGSGMGSLLFMFGFFVVLYFMIWRPQNKRAKEHRQLLEAIGPSDEVVMSGGILGKVLRIKDEFWFFKSLRRNDCAKSLGGSGSSERDFGRYKMNRFPLWKNLVLVFLAVVTFVYALPNLFGEDPAVQISGNTQHPVRAIEASLKDVLEKEKIPVKSYETGDQQILVRFAEPDVQLKAQELIKANLPEDYTVALNMAPATLPGFKPWVPSR